MPNVKEDERNYNLRNNLGKASFLGADPSRRSDSIEKLIESCATASWLL